MSHSVRLRFIDWLQSVIDKVREHVAKDLGVYQPHSVARNDAHLWRIRPVSVNGPQAQIDNTIGDPVLCDKVAEYNQSIAVHNLSVDTLGQRIGIAGFNNHFIGHQKLPLGENVDVGSLNAKTAGVQS